ncbi:hypothetical protein AXF42_Ash006648 [Apostasia shenzhenica]|uniref:Uncharacterized protein n=1 Tax=Apostasia shenzhenica TaxID=1088818 RepID=A0A2I0AJ03_9ASPA|nr:hypothetical protein AXF42_Ash006648 [Apostasia shenzhenica]
MVSKFLDVRQINPILLTCGNSGKGGEVEEKIWRDEAEKQGKEEACLKLFGVLLKKNNVEESLVRRKRRRYRGGSVGDLPACRGPLMGVSSLEAGSEIIH